MDTPTAPDDARVPGQEADELTFHDEGADLSSETEQEVRALPRILFWLLLVYLVFDYGRPQDVLPGLGLIRPAAIVTILLTGAFLFASRLWIKGSGQVRAVWAFVALLVLHVPFATNNFFAYQAAWSMVLLLPFVLSLPVAAGNLAAVRSILRFCVLFMAYQAGFAVLHGGRGTGATLSDENDVALFINTYLPFAYFLFRVERRIWWKVLHAGALVLGVAAIVASRSRGGFVGLLVMAAVTWVLSPRKIRSLAVMAVVGALLVSFANESYWQRMSTATDSETGTGRARVESWRAGWRMFVDNPLGVGGGNFQVRFPEYQADSFARGMWGRVAHSLWFTLLPELGIPGIVVYGLLLFFNLRDSVRLRSRGRNTLGDDGRLLVGLGSAFLASLAGFFASGTFLSVLYYPHYWYLTGFIVAASSAAVAVGSAAPDAEREEALSTS